MIAYDSFHHEFYAASNMTTFRVSPTSPTSTSTTCLSMKTGKNKTNKPNKPNKCYQVHIPYNLHFRAYWHAMASLGLELSGQVDSGHRDFLVTK